MAKDLITGNQAFAYAALKAGVRVCAGYPGTPSSEVIETVAAAHERGVAKGVHVEWSTNEKAALELLAGASYAGARTLFTCKQVGMNVASDPLMSLNYVGVKGGTVLYVTDDPGPISSQTEQDTRRFAAFAKVPVFDPSTPEQGCAMMEAAFDVSEAYMTPVFVRPTTRVCHASTYMDVPESTVARETDGFKRDSRWVIFPKRAYAAHDEINDRLPKIAADFASDRFAEFNPITTIGGAAEGAAGPAAATDAAASETDSAAAAPTLGVVAGGISYAYAREALRLLEEWAQAGQLIDVDDAAVTTLPTLRIMQVGTPYPFPADRAVQFAEGLTDLIVFEELDHVLEDEMLKLAGQRHLPYAVHGKLTGEASTRGENSIDCIAEQLLAFLGLQRVGSFAEAVVAATEAGLAEAQPPARPPLLCPGCPHRGAFYALKSVLRRRTDGVFCGDIGCYTLGNAKPLDAVDTCLCMGAGVTIAQGFSVVEPGKKALAFIGDSTFFASGMTGVANAVYNQHDITICVLDNATTAMTGGQPHPGTGITLMGPKSEPISIEGVLRALGVKCITHADPLNLPQSQEAAREAIDYEGPSAIIFESPCVKLCKPQPAVEVNLDACTGCGRCVLTIGCPALSWNADERHPEVDTSLCNGCGLCTDLCRDDALSCASRPDTLAASAKEARHD